VTYVTHTLDEAPEVEPHAHRIRFGDSLALDYRDDAADVLRQFAADLMLAADVLDEEHRVAKHSLDEAGVWIAQMRHKRGEIGEDGMCLDCALGDHSGHKPYNEGRCYGCSCEVVEVEA